eukprot:3350419-Rhodomonas_salina.2
MVRGSFPPRLSPPSSGWPALPLKEWHSLGLCRSKSRMRWSPLSALLPTSVQSSCHPSPAPLDVAPGPDLWRLNNLFSQTRLFLPLSAVRPTR